MTKVDFGGHADYADTMNVEGLSKPSIGAATLLSTP